MPKSQNITDRVLPQPVILMDLASEGALRVPGIRAMAKQVLVFLLLLVGMGLPVSSHAGNQASCRHDSGIRAGQHETLSLTESEWQNNASILVKEVAFNTEKQNFRLFIPLFENEEDDDLISFRKHLTGSSYSTSVFLAPANDSFLRRVTCIHSINKDFSYKSSQLYLMFEVFRI